MVNHLLINAGSWMHATKPQMVHLTRNSTPFIRISSAKRCPNCKTLSILLIKPEQLPDALIDILVVTIGAIHSMGVDAEGAS